MGTPTIFISHRHDDRLIACILKSTFEDWSNRTIPVFQSSHPKSGPTIGKPLKAELKEQLANADVVFLVFTVQDEDWSYCMWECGVATDPKSQKTSIVVLQCAEEVPAPLNDLTRITIEPDSIKTFTTQFHTSDSFFPQLSQAFAPGIGDELINERTERLYTSLKDAMTRREEARKQIEEKRWLFFTLRFTLNGEKKRTIKEAEDTVAANLTEEAVTEQCYVKYAGSETLQHFGYNKLEEELKLIDLYRRWENKVSYKHDWFTELCQQVMHIMRNEPAQEVGVAFNSVGSPDRWYLPVINRLTAGADGCSWEFRVELYRITPNGDNLKLYNPRTRRPIPKPRRVLRSAPSPTRQATGRTRA